MSRAVRLIAGIALGLLMTVAAQANEKKIKPADVPSAVQRTADAESGGNAVTGYTKDTVEGETVYKANLVVDGHARVVTIGYDGSVTSVENEVAWEAVPVDVQTNFTRVAGKGKLSDFRSVSKDGQIVSYNALLLTNGNRNHVSVKPHATELEAIPSAPPVSEKK
jgi:hypothetical protein